MLPALIVETKDLPRSLHTWLSNYSLTFPVLATILQAF
jgi:hypothetical protein